MRDAGLEESRVFSLGNAAWHVFLSDTYSPPLGTEVGLRVHEAVLSVSQFLAEYIDKSPFASLGKE